MKKTRLVALTLVGLMAFSSTTPAFAADTTIGFTKTAPNKTFTMTVPTGSTSIATNGDFTSIGELKVESTAAFDTDSKVEVTVTRSTVLTNADETIETNNTITYDLYTGTAKGDDNKVASGDKIEFSATQIDAKTAVSMGVAISGTNFKQLEPGDYRDTITFAAEAKDAAPAVTYDRTGKTALSSENLGTPTSWIYEGTTYQVYNAFIPYSSGSSWNDAMGFVAALNTAKFDGHEDWILLSSKAMAEAYAGKTDGVTGAMPESSVCGNVYWLWSSVEYANNALLAHSIYIDGGAWGTDAKSGTSSNGGFVVLRGSTSSSDS